MSPHRVALALLLLAGAPALAQEPEAPADYLLQTEEEFLRLPPNTPAGTLVSVVYVKFLKLFQGQLKLFASQIPDGRLVVRDAALIERLERFSSDSEGQKLSSRRSNIQVFGAVRRGADERSFTLEVSRVRLLETDEQLFTRKAAQIPEGEWNRRLILAHEVSARAKLLDDDQERAGLYRLVKRLSDESRAQERAQLEPLPGGAEGWIRFGKRHKDVEVLASVCEAQKVPDALRQQAERELRALGARSYLGKWLAYEAFKQKLGLVQVQDGGEARWVSADRAAFLKAIEAEKKNWKTNVPDFGLFDDAFLLQEARNGKLLRGMKKPLVLQVARGQAGESWIPVRVDRVRERYEQGPLTWEQWVMPDGTRVYFYNTFLISKEP